MPRTIKLQIRGVPQTVRALKAIPPKVRKGTIDGLNAGGAIVMNEVRQSILKGPKTGRVYHRYRPSRLHRASAPGEAPANDTGELLRSLFLKIDTTELRAIISASAKHAKWLEYGTRWLLARPFLRPALTKTRALVTKTIGELIKRALK